MRCKDAGKYKQFRRGIDQLDTEGVVQVLSSDLRGDQAPVLAAVGPLQFDVVLHRLEHEFGATSELDHLDYEMARLTDEDGIDALAGARGAEVLTRRLDGALLALFADKWRLNAIQRDNPSLRLDPLLAGTAVRYAGSLSGARLRSMSGRGVTSSARCRSGRSRRVPLVMPPPPDHCHISAYLLDDGLPAEELAHVVVPCRHQPVARADRCEVSGR